MMPMIDTHVHYNLEPLYSGKKAHFKISDDSVILHQSWHDHWQQAQKKGIEKSIVVGTNLTTSRQAIKIAQADNNLMASVGLHPHEANNLSAEQEMAAAINSLKILIKKNFSQIAAIGETGLDYYLSAESSALQKKLFTEQIKIANELQLPLIIHCRDQNETAYLEADRLIADYFQFKSPLIFHCISGPLVHLKKILDFGAYVGVGANVTYPNARHLRDLINQVPTDRLLIETDAPYLPPQNYRGQICQPWMIIETMKFLNLNFKINQKQIYQNTLKVFNFAI